MTGEEAIPLRYNTATNRKFGGEKMMTRACWVRMGQRMTGWLGLGIAIAPLVVPALAQASPLQSNQPLPPQSATPTPNPTENSSLSISLAPIAPSCPFPDIPISSTAHAKMFPSQPAQVSIDPNSVEAFSPGDNSDSDRKYNATRLARGGQPDKALEVAKTIEDATRREAALQEVAKAYVKQGEPDQALTVANQIKTPKRQDEAFAEIATAYMEVGKKEQGMKLAERITNGFDQAFAWIGVASYLSSAQQYAEVAQVLPKAIAAAKTMTPEQTGYVQVAVWAKIAEQYLAIGQVEPAIDALLQALTPAKTEPLVYLDLLGSIARLYGATEQPAKAAALFQQAMTGADQIREPFLKATALARIANQTELFGQQQRTAEIVAQALKAAAAEKQDKAIALVTIARAYGVLGRYDQALQVNDKVQPESLRNEVKQALLCSQQQGR